MKFKDYKYERPNLTEIEKQFKKAIEVIKNSKDINEVTKTIDEINKVRRTYDTMAALCDIRSSIDTRDKFYEEEQNFFDENTPIYSNYEFELSKVLINSSFRGELETKYGKQWINLIEA